MLIALCAVSVAAFVVLSTGNESDGPGDPSAPTAASEVEPDTQVESDLEFSTDPSGGWDYYGNPWTPTYLANLPLTDGWRISYRFEAERSGTMVGFQNYFTGNVGHDGYASGTGGTIYAVLVPDDGSGLPDMSQVLAELTWQPELTDGLSSPPDVSTSEGHPVHFAEKFWESSPSLSEGHVYHVVFENIDADPNNWISLNNPYAVRDDDRGDLAPSVRSWGMTLDQGSGFAENTRREALDSNGNRYDVNLLVLMDDGEHFGNSYMEAKDDYPVSGSERVRQIFQPVDDVTVDELSFFAAGSGTMRVDLLGDGDVIGTWTVEVTGDDWSHYGIEFEPFTLTADVFHALEFSAESGSMMMGTYRDGSLGTGKVYAPGGSWDDGFAQVSSGGDWEDAFFAYADLTGVAFSLA